VVDISEESTLIEWIDEFSDNNAASRVQAIMSEVDYTKAAKLVDSLGNITYSLYIPSTNPLSLKNVWIYKNNSGIQFRLIHYQMDPDWYDSFELFPGWDHFTGDFSVYNIDGSKLYQVYMIDGKSQDTESNSRVADVNACSNNSRIEGYWECTTTTWRICKTLGGVNDCYYETDTDCTWMDGCEDTGGCPDCGPTYDPGYENGSSTSNPSEECPANYEMVKGRCVPTCKSNDGGECVECDEGMVYDEILSKCVEAITPCEKAMIAADVYNTQNGEYAESSEPLPFELHGAWSLNKSVDLSHLKLYDPDSDFNSALYEKTLRTGEIVYVYATEGSASVQDIKENINQLFGTSSQYKLSVSNAHEISSILAGKQLYFVGHSLGGGLASINALATGRPAFTYNAAALSQETKDLYQEYSSDIIQATIVEGEIVDFLQKHYLQLQAEGVINYIDEESSLFRDFFNNMHPALQTYEATRLHFIEILECL